MRRKYGIIISKLGSGVFGVDVERYSMQQSEAQFSGVKQRKTHMKKLMAFAAVAACGAAFAVEVFARDLHAVGDLWQG